MVRSALAVACLPMLVGAAIGCRDVVGSAMACPPRGVWDATALAVDAVGRTVVGGAIGAVATVTAPLWMPLAALTWWRGRGPV